MRTRIFGEPIRIENFVVPRQTFIPSSFFTNIFWELLKIALNSFNLDFVTVVYDNLDSAHREYQLS